jgi:hypothetical protein
LGRPGGNLPGTTIILAASLMGLKLASDHLSDVQNVRDFGLQFRLSQSYINWTSQSGVKINAVTYNQNLLASNNTGKPSYTEPTSNGTNPNYASQTYQVPSDAIIDWGGNVVVPASRQQSSGGTKK